MRRVLLLLLGCLLIVPSVFAVPDLQLFIPGATYTGENAVDPETYVTNNSSFDLYVIGAAGTNDVLLSVALTGFDQSADVSGVAVTINGTTYNNWQWGTPPVATINSGPPGDLAGHGIYPTWFLEVNAGDFASVGNIGNTVDDSWDPSTGYFSGGNTMGEIKTYAVSITGVGDGQGVHFDAYNLTTDNKIDKFAPFSHDAAYQNGTPTNPIPEPTTMVLFGLGLASAAVVRRFRKA